MKHHPFLKENPPRSVDTKLFKKKHGEICPPICPDFLWVDLSGSILKRSSTTNSIRDPIMRPPGGRWSQRRAEVFKVTKVFEGYAVVISTREYVGIPASDGVMSDIFYICTLNHGSLFQINSCVYVTR